MLTDRRTLRIRPRRIAAPARPLTDEQLAERAAASRLEPRIADMCAEWGLWCATRRLLAPPPLRCVLGRLRTAAPSGTPEGPRVRLDAHVAAFHAALQMQDERRRAVLWGLYALPAQYGRVPAKVVAQALGMSRTHLYRLRDDAARAAYAGRFAVLDVAAEAVAAARKRELVVD